MSRFLKFTILFALMLPIFSACGGNRNSAQEAEVNNDPVVRFATPRDGQTVTSPVKVRMNALNYTIEAAGEVNEGAGHFHVLVDQDCVEAGVVIPATEGYLHFGGAQLEADIEMEPGEHTLCLQVGDGIHTATELTEVITIVVE